MTYYTRAVVPYSVPQGSASGSSATAYGGNSTVHIHNAAPAAPVPARRSWLQNVRDAVISTVGIAALGVGSYLGFQYNQNPDGDNIISKSLKPDIVNVKFQPTIRNIMPRQKDDSQWKLKTQSKLDSMAAAGQEVIFLPPVDTTLAAPPKAVAADSTSSAPKLGL